jgi:hypothetical protein
MIYETMQSDSEFAHERTNIHYKRASYLTDALT